MIKFDKKRAFRVAMGATAGLGLAAALALGVAGEGVAAGETSPACSNATAILMVGTKNDADDRWGKIKYFFQNKRVWELGAMVPGQGSPSQLVQFDIPSYAGGPDTAFTVRCGAGGTCNAIAAQFAADYKEMKPAPMVLCGESPMLSNPTDAR